MSVKERLIEFLEQKEISQSKFEKLVGLSNGFVNNIGDSIRTRSMLKITLVYPELNTSWLLTGQGDMLNPELVSASDLSIRKPKTQSNPYLVPFVDIPAQAGYTKAYSNIDYITTLKHYPILPDVDPAGASWRYFQVEGDSMEPEIRGGDTILASLVLKEDWPDVKDYYTHVVVTDEDLLIKDVLKENNKSWILLSQNSSVKPKRVKLEDIKQVWILRRHIRNRVNKSRMYDLKEIKNQLK